MSDDESNSEELPPVIVIDRGSLEWKCGLAGDEEIGAIISRDAEAARLRRAFAELEAEPGDHAVLLSESAGTTPEERASVAALLFGSQFGVRALCFAAAPVLPLYHYAVESSCLVVDIGEQRTTLLPVHADGYAILGAAVCIDLGGAHLVRWLAGRLLELRAQLAGSASAKAPPAVDEMEAIARQVLKESVAVALDSRKKEKLPPVKVT